MSTRSDRAAERKAVKQAEKDVKQAGSAARKAFDLKDPRFLGEAAVAATRGPVGLALFGASRGIQVLRDRRAEQADLLSDLASDAKGHADALRERTSALASPKEKRSPLRRFAPLWVLGLAVGAAVAGAAAYFLRGGDHSGAAPSTTPRTTGSTEPANGPASDASTSGTPSSSAPGYSTPPASPPATGSGPGAASETGEDLTMESPDPEGPSDQADGTSPAAGSSSPGAAAGSAPQPSDDTPADGTPSDTQ